MRLGNDIWIYGALVVLFFIYKIVEVFHPDLPFAHAYLEDLIAIPLVLKTALLAVQQVRGKWSSYTLSTAEAIVITVLFSAYFEWMLPARNPLFTADVWDVLCYGIGCAFFLLWLNTPSVPHTGLNMALAQLFSRTKSARK